MDTRRDFEVRVRLRRCNVLVQQVVWKVVHDMVDVHALHSIQLFPTLLHHLHFLPLAPRPPARLLLSRFHIINSFPIPPPRRQWRTDSLKHN